VATPAAATTKPLPQQQAASAIALRGPLRSTQVPPKAADNPSIRIAMLKIHPIGVRVVSK
jgi:hypothetical protein